MNKLKAIPPDGATPIGHQTMQELTGRSDWQEPDLNPPHYPDHSQRDKPVGCLAKRLKELRSK